MFALRLAPLAAALAAATHDIRIEKPGNGRVDRDATAEYTSPED